MRRRCLSMLLAAAVLGTGCGGGVFLSYNFDDDDDHHGGDGGPAIALSADVSRAPPGGTVRLSAVASDFDGVAEVVFQRLDDNGNVLLNRDGAAPYTALTTIPLDAEGSVSYSARATDRWGNRGDTDIVSIGVIR